MLSVGKACISAVEGFLYRCLRRITRVLPEVSGTITHRRAAARAAPFVDRALPADEGRQPLQRGRWEGTKWDGLLPDNLLSCGVNTSYAGTYHKEDCVA